MATAFAEGEDFGRELAQMVKAAIAEAVAPLKASNEALHARVAELEARPAPEKGEAGERGTDGISPEPEAIAAVLLPVAEEMIVAEVAKAVGTLPSPERGEKGDQGEAGQRGEPGADGANGKDGAGIIDGFVTRDGHLIATLSDGSTRDFGEIIGKDGRDGNDGATGRDGFGFDDMDACVLDDDRTIELSFRRGEEEKAFTFKWPTTIYRNVYKEGEQYEPGDMVTWAGSLWHCDNATHSKPGTDDWTLAAKKGRDGKDAKPNG